MVWTGIKNGVHQKIKMIIMASLLTSLRVNQRTATNCFTAARVNYHLNRMLFLGEQFCLIKFPPSTALILITIVNLPIYSDWDPDNILALHHISFHYFIENVQMYLQVALSWNLPTSPDLGNNWVVTWPYFSLILNKYKGHFNSYFTMNILSFWNWNLKKKRGKELLKFLKFRFIWKC